MKGESIADRRLRHAGLERFNIAGDVSANFVKAFQDRTRGMFENRWPVNPSYLEKAMRDYGMDCYLQGVLDGASPEVTELLKSSEQ